MDKYQINRKKTKYNKTTRIEGNEQDKIRQDNKYQNKRNRTKYTKTTSIRSQGKGQNMLGQ